MNTEPFETAKGLWDEVLKSAVDHKFTVFGRDAAEAARFYSEAQDFMYTPQYSGGTVPYGPLIPGGFYMAVRHRMSTNLVFNLVQAFLPFLYSKDPVRTVTPRKPKIPDQLVSWLAMYKTQAQGQQLMQLPAIQQNPQLGQLIQQQVQQSAKQAAQTRQSHDQTYGSPGQQPPSQDDVKAQIRAGLMEWVLNASTKVTDLKGESRKALVDALVKGRGILSCELMRWGQYSIPFSRYINVDDFFVDPDAKELKDAKWIAILRREPVWEVEQTYGWPLGSLRADYESYTQEAAINISTTKEYDRQTHGKTNDILEYYEIYSRMGVGSFLRDASSDLHMYLDGFGPNVRLLVTRDQRMPINLPPWLFFTDGTQDSNPPTTAEITDEISKRLAWPVPTWKRPGDTPWPLAILDFHRQLNESWPIAHVTPALAYVKAINWIFSYMMGRIHHASRTLLCVPKNLEEDIKDAILHGSDLELLEIEKARPGTMDEIVRMLQFPDAPKEVWNVLAAVQKMFEDSTGVTELMLSGQTQHQFRSAAEANVKEQASQARPSDMANTVEDWQAETGRNEAYAWTLLTELQDVAAIFGEPYQQAGEQMIDCEPTPTPAQMGQYTSLWLETVASEDPTSLSTYFDFDVEAGSAEKKNRQQQIAVAQQTLQSLLPLQYQYYTRTGDSSQINAAIRNWAVAIEHPAPDELMFPDRQQEMQAMQQQAQEMAQFNLEHKEAEQQGRHPENPQQLQQQISAPPGQPQMHPELAATMGQQ